MITPEGTYRHAHTRARAHRSTHIPSLKPRHYAPLTPRFQAGAAVVCRSVWQHSLGLQHFGASVSAWYEQLRVLSGMLQAQLTGPNCCSTRFPNPNEESASVLMPLKKFARKESFYCVHFLNVCTHLDNVVDFCDCTYSLCGLSHLKVKVNRLFPQGF